MARIQVLREQRTNVLPVDAIAFAARGQMARSRTSAQRFGVESAEPGHVRVVSQGHLPSSSERTQRAELVRVSDG